MGASFLKLLLNYRQVPKLGALRGSFVPPYKGPWDTHWCGGKKGARFIGLRHGPTLCGRARRAAGEGHRTGQEHRCRCRTRLAAKASAACLHYRALL